MSDDGETIELLRDEVSFLRAQLEASKTRVRELESALDISANRLESVAIAIKQHGTNINPDFFIEGFSKFANEARSALAKKETR